MRTCFAIYDIVFTSFHVEFELMKRRSITNYENELPPAGIQTKK
jgi:hypothetical protein